MLRIGYNPYSYSNNNTSFGASRIKPKEGQLLKLSELGIKGDDWTEKDVLDAMSKKFVGNRKKKKKTN